MVGAAALVDVGELQFFDRVGDLVQVMLGQMQIPGCYFQILMTEQKLDGAQVGFRLPADAWPSCGEPGGV